MSGPFSRTLLAGGAALAVLAFVPVAAYAADPSASGTTSGPSSGGNVAPGGGASKNTTGQQTGGNDAHSLGLSSGAVSAGAPGVAGKPGAEADPGQTPAPGQRKTNQQ